MGCIIMRKEVVTLGVLVAVLLVINSLFLVIILNSQHQKNSDIGIDTRVGHAVLSMNDPVKLFTPEVLTMYAPDEKKTSSVVVKTPTVTTTTSSKKTASNFISKFVPFIGIEEEEKPNIRTVITPEGEELIVNYDKKIITYKKEEFPMMIDPIMDGGGNTVPFPTEKNGRAGTTTLSFNEFNILIDTDYYLNSENTANLNDFFDKFELRFDELESQTGWSAEEYFGDKLNITIFPTDGCWGGEASPAEATVYLSDPFYKVECQRPYYTEFDGSPQYGNSGELGDNWTYMSGMIHEATHAISPLPILTRAWLSEGFARYNEYNMLSNSPYGDINQETADTYLYLGSTAYNWEAYVANDYHDTCTSECLGTPYAEIQASYGYAIPAWMLNMMRDPSYSEDWAPVLNAMDFADFYGIIDNNRETLYSTMGQPYQKKDTLIIGLIGSASDMPFHHIKNVWRYSGSDGPGWGVREWVDLDWYADLEPEILSITPTDDFPTSETPIETIAVTAKVMNHGDVDIENLEYEIVYDNGAKTSTRHSAPTIPARGEETITVPNYQVSSDGPVKISIIVDPDSLKLETDKTNNEISAWVGFEPMVEPAVNEKSTVYIVPKANNYVGGEITFDITDDTYEWFTWDDFNKRFYWQTAETSAGEFDFEVDAIQGGIVKDTQTVHVTVRNTCVEYDKDQGCWDCVCPHRPLPHMS